LTCRECCSAGVFAEIEVLLLQRRGLEVRCRRIGHGHIALITPDELELVMVAPLRCEACVEGLAHAH